ncbi:hypothetical protein HMPREF3185_01627 [Porphyromonas somerae]|uniref:Uncharacterized protein n=1 Tax=Porphyromonas somerae TaxID=322095 RepID=A0A134B468_9PORP|nr:hypothetical protein HMPREF3184_01627 [Porphyromonadaceae bacterium KA00676]KXB74735.1 hypothetical protein HMPREF3185_01627 [Porphyromonas somerae]
MIVNTYCALFPPIPLCIRLDEGLQRYTIFKNFSSLIDLFLDTFHRFAVVRSGTTSVLLVKKKAPSRRVFFYLCTWS